MHDFYKYESLFILEILLLKFPINKIWPKLDKFRIYFVK